MYQQWDFLTGYINTDVFVHEDVLYLCLLCVFWQLNRSDSDSSTLAKKSLFVRNATERRSLRVKRVCAELPGRGLKQSMGRVGAVNNLNRMLYLKYFSKSDASTSCSPVVSGWDLNTVVWVLHLPPPTKLMLFWLWLKPVGGHWCPAAWHLLLNFSLLLLKNSNITKWPKVAYAAQKSIPATYILSKFWWKF